MLMISVYVISWLVLLLCDWIQSSRYTELKMEFYEILNWLNNYLNRRNRVLERQNEDPALSSNVPSTDESKNANENEED